MADTDDYIMETWDHYRLKMKQRNAGNPAHLACLLTIADLLHSWLVTQPEEKPEDPDLENY